MVRMLVAGFLAGVFATAVIARAPQQGPFELSCSTLPFETIKKDDRHIDKVCDRPARQRPSRSAHRTAPRTSSAPAVPPP
jgi:hypothetical protein